MRLNQQTEKASVQMVPTVKRGPESNLNGFNEDSLQLQGSYQSAFIKFILASLAGIVIFFVPVRGRLIFEIIYKDIAKTTFYLYF